MTNRARRPLMFKPGYEGPRPAPRLTPREAEDFAPKVQALTRRLHDAMLTLSTLRGAMTRGGSTWPDYVHEFSDKVGWDAVEELVHVPFRPTPDQLDDVSPTLALLEGVSPAFLKVLALRAIGERVGGFSFATIGERYGQTSAWARSVHTACIIVAARRSGLLDPAPRGWTLVVAGVRLGGWRTFLTTASNPASAIYDLKSKSPVELESASAVWVAGKPEAGALVARVRQELKGRNLHGGWHLIPPADLLDLIIVQQTQLERPYDLEALRLPPPRMTAASAGRVMVDSALSAAEAEAEG